MPIKTVLKENRLTKGLYMQLKKINDKRKREKCFKYNGSFIDRRKRSNSLCIILAGYKEYLYENVFERMKRFAPADIDVCVVTSGKYSSQIDNICKQNEWSYLSTKENNVSLVQNVAISLHPEAQYIYKIDEDIFITNNYFEKMMDAYLLAKTSDYDPGFVAPLIPVNGFSHLIVLQKLGLVEEYTKRFEAPKYMTGNERKIQSDPQAAMFFWGEGGTVPHIDYMNELFSKNDKKVIPCPIRFSIGAILFERRLWEEMGYFEVDKYGNSMGVDESQICAYCMRASRPIMVSENTLVGHFSFGPQTNGMIDFFHEHPENFRMQ